MEKWKKVIWQAVICIGLLCVIWSGYLFTLNPLKKRNKVEAIRNQKVEADYNILSSLEEIYIEEGKIEISGWVLHLNARKIALNVVFQPVGSGEAKVFLTKSVERKDVENYFVPGRAFDECGFEVDIEKKELKKNVCYEVFLFLEYEEESEEGKEKVEKCKKVSTGWYYREGKMQRYNPETYVSPDIEDEVLLRVIQEGNLRLFDVNEQIWIYQYGSQLYYIIKTAIESMEKENIGVPVMPHTSRADLLPESRRQYGFDHIGFYFEDKTYQKVGVLPYQIVVVDLPKEYPITYISTGMYDNKNNIWIRDYMVEMADWSFSQSK